MGRVKQIEQEQVVTPVQRVRNDWKTLVDKLSYKAIVTNVPFLAFVALLCVLYINNTQRAVETQRELNKQNKVLRELRWKYMDIKSQLMYTRMETEVIKKAMKLGLQPLMLPAYTIDNTGDTVKAVTP
jgi:cell division protein FtsL